MPNQKDLPVTETTRNPFKITNQTATFPAKGPPVNFRYSFQTNTVRKGGGRGSDLCSYDVHRKKYRGSASSMPCTVATVHVLATHPVSLN